MQVFVEQKQCSRQKLHVLEKLWEGCAYLIYVTFNYKNLMFICDLRLKQKQQEQ